MRTIFLPLLTAFSLALGFASCTKNDSEGRLQEKQKATRSHQKHLQQKPWLYEETGDLGALQKHGTLRLLMARQHLAARLPRGDFPLDHEEKLARKFAKTMGLESVIVYVPSHDQLLAWLEQGKGDMVVASLTITPQRRRKVAFSVPINTVREQLVTRSDDAITSESQLRGRKIAIRLSSSYYSTAKALAATHPGLEIQPMDERLDTEQILQRVAHGQLDTTIADSSIVKAAKKYLPNIKPAMDVSDDRPVAWAVRRGSKQLLSELNAFLSEKIKLENKDEVFTSDLPDLKKRGVLRILTRNTAATYYLYRGELVGFEYDLAREFAKQQGLEVEIIVPPTREDLIPWLLAGRGDVIAASMTLTEKRKSSGAAFSRPYLFVTETLVGRADEPPFESIDQLQGRTVVVRPGSSYMSSLKKIQSSGVEFQIKQAPVDMETEQIIGAVAKKEYDLTVADSHILAIELTYRNDIRALMPLGAKSPLVWAANPKNKKLIDAINTFFKKEYKGLFYNITYNKYFKNTRRMAKQARTRSERTGRLSPYDDIVKKHSTKYKFDWRLIVSQMFAESRFDPKAKSWVGAKGLLQVMPKTARQLGFNDLEDPETGIQAGIRYLSWTRDRFDQELNPYTRNWLALAAYNAGLGHVLDARALARNQGLDPNKWFGNVERAMLLLSKPDFSRRARYGYCRGSEPVAYVRQIRERWRAYKRVSKK